MVSTNDFIKAQNDQHLMRRFSAAASIAGVEDAQNWAATNYHRLLSFKVDGNQTISDVYAYANSVREDALADIPPEPGNNLAAVTDDYLNAAILALSSSS